MLPPDAEITRRLFLDAEAGPADLALVFGSADDEEAARRARHAAELYTNGRVPRLLLTGGDPAGRGTSEAERMAAVVLAAGVPEEALGLETESRTTWENALCSRRWLEAHGGWADLRTVALVSASWHLRRARLLVQRTFPEGLRWVCCPAPGGCEASNWTTRPEWRRLIEVEWYLLHECL